MKTKIYASAGVGWVAGAALVVLAVAGGLRWDLNSLALAGPKEHLSETAALSTAQAAAAGYIEATIGSDHTSQDGAHSPGVKTSAGPINLGQMVRVDLRFVPNAREVVAAIDSGASFERERDVWVASWERAGVYDVSSGTDDGTAYVVVVIEDGTGKLLAASSGVREAEKQARARGPLPSFGELFGVSQ